MDELEVVQYQQINGINVFTNSVVYRSPHFHQDWELVWLLDAPLQINCMHTVQILQPGDVALFPPNCTHELLTLDKPCTFLCIQISPTGFPTTAGYVIDRISVREAMQPEQFQKLRQTMLEIARAYFERGEQYELFCYGRSAMLLYGLLTQLPFRKISTEEAEGIAQQKARLLRLVEFVETGYQHKIRLADFAEQEHCSVSYLSHFIKETMNQTFQEYVDSVRFNVACKLIAEGKDSMVSISHAAGFSDYRYFSRAFQRSFGMTPAQYSKQEHFPAGQESKAFRFHSEERQLTRNQSLFLLRKFDACLQES